MNLDELPILLKKNVRVLRPCEFNAVVKAIPKLEYKTLFKGLTVSGMRYVEAQRFQESLHWFDGQHINLPSMSMKKTKCKQSGRTVWLSSSGKEIIFAFVNIKKKLPGYSAWNEDLVRWAEIAELSTNNNGEFRLSPKSSRKTYESWLVAYYPDKLPLIALSQGHNTDTAIRHYWNTAYKPDEKSGMKQYVEGWS